MNEISDTKSTDYNVIISEIESHLVEILDPTTKEQVYIKSSKAKKIDKDTKKEPIIRFC